MTFVLDTDHMTLLEWGGPASGPLRERLAESADEGVATTIISYEEQMRGWMAYMFVAVFRAVGAKTDG